MTASETRSLIIAINVRLTQGISQFPGALRDFDSDVYPYVQALTVSDYLDRFACFFSEALGGNNLSIAESAATVAKIHWDINVHGHFFADGCGRTATILGAWAYWVNEGSIPHVPARGEYLELAKSGCEDWFTRGLADYILNHVE